MNVLFALDNYDHGSGGAEMSAQAIARQLAARGHTVQVLQEGKDERSYDDGPVRVHTRPLPSRGWIKNRHRHTRRTNRAWRPHLEAFLDAWPADLVLTHGRLLISTVEVARERDLHVAVFIRGYHMFCPNKFLDRDALTECDRNCSRCLPRRYRWRYRSMQRTLDRYEAALRQASLLVANSGYVQKVIERFLGLPSTILYPAVRPRVYEAEEADRTRVLFVKPQQVKGLPIFMDVAAAMPDTPFLVAGKTRRHLRLKFQRLGNVETLGWVKDMREAYARTRVLLGPSIWPEPFGRVFVEAGANGIPSVASARGGIPEAIGDGGLLVEDIFDTESWVAALRRLESPDLYAELAAKARAHAERFTPEATVAQFAKDIRSRLGLEL
jgi:glycosyltransferase involved in cell wall biosynthesis